jgi:hypothetical protein
MAEINAKINISPDLKNLIENNKEIAPRSVKEGMKKITRQAPKQVRKKIRTLGLVKTGHLVKTIRGKTKKDKSIIGSQHFVGHILEGGAKPHKIKAKRGKMLWWPGIKRPVKRVNHPGVKAYKFLESTIDDMENSGEIESLFSEGVRQAIEELSSNG